MNLKKLREYTFTINKNIKTLFILYIIYITILSIVIIFIYDFTKALEFTLISFAVFWIFIIIILRINESKGKEKTKELNNN